MGSQWQLWSSQPHYPITLIGVDMPTTDEIRDFVFHLQDRVHGEKHNQQAIDQTFYWDIFNVPLLRKATKDGDVVNAQVVDSEYTIRMGAAMDLVNSVTSQIITDNPQVFRKPLADNATSRERANRIGIETNRWARHALYQEPQLYHEITKDMLVYGEAIIHTVHNQTLAEWDKSEHGGKSWQDVVPEAMPVKLFRMHPMIVYIDPKDMEDGIVKRAVISFERSIGDIKRIYPFFDAQGKEVEDTTPFFIYWDEKIRYSEAGGRDNRQPLFKDDEGVLSNGDGIQKNPYGFVPFTHAYSGFGSGTPDNNPASLAVSRLRSMRGQLVEDTTIRSNLNFGIHKSMHRHKDIINKSGKALGPDAFKDYSEKPYTINEIIIPAAAEIVVSDSLMPDAQVFQYYLNVHADLLAQDPPTLRGFPSGTSGRQEDILGSRGLRLYDSIVFGTSRSAETAIGHGLRILEKMPFLRPPGLKEGDIEKHWKVTLQLKASDVVDADRLSNQGSALVTSGQLSNRTNLIKFQGFTADEADDEQAQQLAERFISSDAVGAALAQRAAEKSVMGNELAAVTEQAAQIEGDAARPKEVRTRRGREEADVNATQRGTRETAV